MSNAIIEILRRYPSLDLPDMETTLRSLNSDTYLVAAPIHSAKGLPDGTYSGRGVISSESDQPLPYYLYVAVNGLSEAKDLYSTFATSGADDNLEKLGHTGFLTLADGQEPPIKATPEALLRSARALLESGNFAAAGDELAGLTDHPAATARDVAEGSRLRADLLLLEGHVPEGLAAIERLIPLFHERPEDLLETAVLLVRLGLANPGLGLAARVVELQPSEQSHLTLARLAGATLPTWMGIREYSDLIGLYPDSMAGYFERGQLFVRSGFFYRAAADFSEALSHGGDEAALLTERCVAYANAQEFELAVADCEHAQEIEPQSERLDLLSQIYEQLESDTGTTQDESAQR